MARKPVTAGYHYYNANSKQSHVPDCVCRALSLALGVEYDTMRRELLAWMRENEAHSYKTPAVFGSYLEEKYGAKMTKIAVTDGPFWVQDKCITVERFCEEYPSGTYVVVCGKKRFMEHAVAVIDGDYWDNWNSGEYLVHSYWKIEGSQGIVTKESEENIIALEKPLEKYFIPYVAHLAKKLPWAMVTQSWNIKNTTYGWVLLRVIPDDVESYGLPKYYQHFQSSKRFTFTFNPSMSVEANIEAQTKRLHVAIREWLYQIRKDADDEVRDEKLRRGEIKTHPKFSSSWYRELLLKLPDEIIPYVLEIQDYGSDFESYGHFWRYVVEVEAMPGDPEGETENVVDLRADSWTEIKRQAKDYLNKFERPYI